MNLQERVERYKGRNFQDVDAEVLVLIEESAAAIFTVFPNHFILCGGASLVLFHQSPRLSRDLDLLASPAKLPSSEEIQSVVGSSIQPIAETFGLGQLNFREDSASPDFVRHWVIANQKPLFSIDLSRIVGNVLQSQIIKQTITGVPDKTVLTLSANYLLLQKCETFLGRRYLKARDAFDIHLLLTRSALLDEILQAHLEDSIVMKEIHLGSIENRIQSVNTKLCTVELRTVLPPIIFDELAKNEFEPIRKSLRTVFSHWLGEPEQ